MRVYEMRVVASIINWYWGNIFLYSWYSFDFHPLKYLNFPPFFIGRSPTTYSSSSTATKEESDLQTAQRKTFHSKQSNLPRLSSTDGLAENFSQVVQMQGTNFEVMPTFTWVWDEKKMNTCFRTGLSTTQRARKF